MAYSGERITNIVVVVLVALGLFLFTKFKLRINNGDVILSQAQLAQEIIAYLEKIDPDTPYQYNAQYTEITPKGDRKGHRINLQNIFLRAKNMSKAERAAFFDDFFSETNAEDLDLQTLEQGLLPRVRTPSELSLRQIFYATHAGDDPEQKNVVESYGDLSIEPVLDGERTLRILTPDQLKTAGVSEKRAFQLAINNLQNQPKQKWLVNGRVFLSSVQDDFDCARVVVLHDFPDGLQADKAIGFFPSHSICLVTDDPTPENLQEMIEIGLAQSEEHRPLSGYIYRLENERWRRWTPDKTHAGYSIVFRQNFLANLSNHDEQKRALDQVFEKTGRDIFVATLMGYEQDNGLVTVATQTLGADTLLPVADRVIIAQLDTKNEVKMSADLSWSEFQGIMEAVNIRKWDNLYPIRYDITGEALNQLEAYILDKEILKSVATFP